MTYAGVDEKYADPGTAKVVIIPVPYDGTSTWVKGADAGPEALLEASRNMELYDIETGTEVYTCGIFLDEPVREDRSPESMVGAVYQRVNAHLNQGKFIGLIGGEHSISIGSIRAFIDHFKDLTVLQLDAHTDLRPEYNGSQYNHACAMYEASLKTNLVQVGIRSMDSSELSNIAHGKIYYAENITGQISWHDEAIKQCTDNVYITIDLDIFDPAIMPSTGTPEPGGLQWYEVIGFLKKVIAAKHLVGFDLVELCPNEINKAPDMLAAQLFYKIITYKYFI